MTDQLETLSVEDEDTVPFAFDGHTYGMRKRIKRLKFLRLVNSAPAEALQLCFTAEEYERLEDLDLSSEDLGKLLTALAEQFVGGPGNSGPSPQS